MKRFRASSTEGIRHLYLHIPFCHRICPYCSFYKHEPGRLANREFVTSLLGELDRRLGEFDLAPRTLFLGGGTPTLLSPTHLEALFEGLQARVDFDQLEECTIEANPTTFDRGKLALLRSAGVTRFSLGVQSWNEATLATLGRDHAPADGREAYRLLREIGFPAVSLDLMFAVPGQRREQWSQDLAETLALEPDHISAYNLNYEEDTPFFDSLRQGEFRIDAEADATLFLDAMEQLEGAGYRHYEISNYARPGFESAHNAAYWAGADYLGIGPGAVSTIDGRRWTNLPDTAAYVARIGRGDDVRGAYESLDGEATRLERIGLGLRTADGIPEDLVADADLTPLIDATLVSRRNGRIRLTRAGKPLADEITGHLL